MNNLPFYQWAGISGILSAVLFIISIIGMQFFLAGDIHNMENFTENMMDNHSMMLMYGWPGLVATSLILPLVYAFFRLNKSKLQESRVVFVLTIIGLCFIFIGYLFHLALTYFHAPIYQRIGADNKEFFGLLIESTIGLQDMFWLSGDLLSFLGIGGILFLGWSEDVLPKWLLLIGALASIVAAMGSVSFIPAFKPVPGLSFLFIAGFSVFAIWEIIAGIYLIRYQDKLEMHAL